MNEEILVEQRAAIGSHTTQIANQTNNYGLTPEKASEIAIKLFLENFPKLEAQAMCTVKNRVDELIKMIIAGIAEKADVGFDAFAEPDMQYILTEAEKIYARKGTPELCAILSSLIVDRSTCRNNTYMETILDKAIQIVSDLQPKHLDYLSLIFVYKHVRFDDINTLDDLNTRYSEINKYLPLENCDKTSISFFDMEGLITIQLGKAAESLSKTYSFSKEDTIKALPSGQEMIPGDYGLTPVGIVLAIFNLHKKTKYKFSLEKWITRD